MIILESGTIKINDDILNDIADTYVKCSYLKEDYSTFESYLKVMITVLTKQL